MEELELLNKIKNDIMDRSDFFVKISTPNIYNIEINSQVWHEIFKTDEYNKAKNK